MHAVSPSAEKLRAVLYLRQSTHKEESISLELQETAGREYARQRGYEVVGVESDPGISGRTWNRPAVQRVMVAVEEHRVDVVILWKWSRLSRSRLDWAVAVDKIESLGGRIESATEPLDTTTSAGRLARGMLAEFAAFESERIGDVWKEAQQRRRLRGLPPNGGDRYGYLRTEDTYEPDPAFAPLLADLYRRHVAGEGHQALAVWLNQHGHRTRTGIPWTRDKVRLMMDSGFAAGLIVQGRLPGARYYPGEHKPIIERDTWDAYLDRRRAAPTPPKVSGRRYFLSGLLFCADCGSPMRVGVRNRKPSYICSRGADTRLVRTTTCTVAHVEAAIFDEMRQYAADIDAQSAAEAAALRSAATPINDEHAIERRLDDLRGQARSITLRWSSGRMKDSTYDDSIAELERQIHELEQRDRARRVTAASAEERAEAMRMLSEWDSLSVNAKHVVVSAYMDAICVVPPRVRKVGGAGRAAYWPVWRFPR